MKSQLALIIMLGLLFSNGVYAQSSGGAKPSGQAFIFEMGPLLPSHVAATDDILHVVSFKYGYPMNESALIEGGYSGSNTAGVKYQNLDLSIRGDLPFQDMFIFGLVGPDLLRIESSGTEPNYYVSGHVAGGLLANIASTLFLRMEMRFAFNPGSMLFFGFGLEYRLGK